MRLALLSSFGRGMLKRRDIRYFIMRKIIYVILPVVLAVALITGVAFSAWQFESVGKSQNNLINKRDDIFENYDIKKASGEQVNKVSTYEMYLYPSTLYLNDYLDCLNGVSGAVLPEEKYGYIEPSVDKSGNVTYNVVDKGGDTAYLSDVAENKTYTMSDASFVKGMYYNVYDGNADWDITVNNGLSGTVTLGGENVAANSRFLYGDPGLDKSPLTYSNSTTGVSLQDTTGERHNWRNLHYFDRFGYWASLAKDDGRYLPLKIKVDENFSNTYYDNVVMSPLADMGDPQNWFVYSFSCWAYIDNTSKQYTAPYFATDEFASANNGTRYVNSDGSANPSLGAFCPTMVSQYFDVIESFEKYADADGVIRLFPKFSNGKGYSAKTVKDGGGDAIKAVPELKDESGNKAEMGTTDQHELYMFYGTETGSFTSGGSTVTVHFSVLPNINIDDYYSLNFKVAPTVYTAGWPGGWNDIYSLGREKASDGDNKNIPDTLKAYGYGMYNLYLFITQVAESTSANDYTENLETLRKNLVNKSDSVNFPSLFGKNLLPIAKAYVGGKSFMLVAEKVREAKFIGDVNFGNTNYTTEEQVEAKYLSTNKSFRLINKELYGYTRNSDGESVKGDQPINSQFPYCYILQNVDFTEATTQYCQIRFQRNYRADLHFAETSEYKYDRIEFSGVVYERGFGNYFNLINADVKHEDGTASTQQVVQLKSEEMRGVYDIILVFRSAREGNENSDIAYNIGLYAYRHTNIFLKIYEGDLTEKMYYYQGSDGAFSGVGGEGTGKAYEFIDHSALPLFNKSYPIGVSIKATDANDGGSVNSIGTTLAGCVNGVVGNKAYDPTKVKIYDHVTGAEVAHYELISNVTENAEGVYLEYGGQYYGLVFNPFKIRKNYIFYIAYE